MYNELVYNLDLCILSYQLYSQTLVWPMDPYYEHIRGALTSRRDNFIEEVRKLDDDIMPEGFDPLCDPIIFNYGQMNPWNPCFSNPENQWDVFSAPAAIIDPVKEINYVRISGGDVKKIKDNPAGPADKTDLIYCFEGRTGKIEETDIGARSCMGFVLARQMAKDPKEYEVHIVFRGVRTGSPERSFAQGKFSKKGNADTKTDMDFGEMETAEDISEVGKVCRGVKTTVLATKAAIIRCLDEIEKWKKVRPTQITIAGHGLGGALATHLASSLLTDYDNKAETLKGWPILSMKVHTYGSPVIGNRAFCEMLGSRIRITRCYSGGDPVTQETFDFKGWPLTGQTHAGTPLPIGSFGIADIQSHEPIIIRKNLVNWLSDLEIDIEGIPGGNYKDKSKKGQEEEKFDDGKPWQVRKTMKEVLALLAIKTENIKKIIPEFADTYFEPFMDSIINTLSEPSSYTFKFKLSSTTAKITALKKIRNAEEATLNSAKKLDELLAGCKKDIDDDDIYNLVGCMLLLRLFAEKNEEAVKATDASECPALAKIMEKI